MRVEAHEPVERRESDGESEKNQSGSARRLQAPGCGDVARFVELLAAYRESEEVTRQRLYLETLQEVLPRVRRIVVAEGGDVFKMLPIEGAGGGK